MPKLTHQQRVAETHATLRSMGFDQRLCTDGFLADMGIREWVHVSSSKRLSHYHIERGMPDTRGRSKADAVAEIFISAARNLIKSL